MSAALTRPPVQLSATAIAAAGRAIGLDHLARLVDQLVGEQIVAHRPSSIRMFATAWAAMPSPRPVKPSRSVVVALMLTCDCGKAEDFRDPRAHGRAMRADLGLLANDRAVDMVDDPAADRGPAAAAWARKMVGRGALPLRVGRREMLADVAEAGGAEQGVGDGVEHDVGIAVAGEAARRGEWRSRPS